MRQDRAQGGNLGRGPWFGVTSGFTLIELLVVIAILSLLVSILMPSLRQALELAQDAACKANLRNYGLGMQMYVQDQDGVIPYCKNGNLYVLDPKAGYDFDRPMTHLAPYVHPDVGPRGSANPLYCPAEFKSHDFYNWAKNLSPTAADWELMRKATSNYGSNWAMAPYEDPEPRGSGVEIDWAEEPAANIVYLGDCKLVKVSPVWDCNGIGYFKWWYLDTANDERAFRHHGLDNYVFLDGHVAPHMELSKASASSPNRDMDLPRLWFKGYKSFGKYNPP